MTLAIQLKLMYVCMHVKLNETCSTAKALCECVCACVKMGYSVILNNSYNQAYSHHKPQQNSNTSLIKIHLTFRETSYHAVFMSKNI